MRRILLAVLVFLLVPAGAQAATLHATTANFASVYAGAAGGDTILLASGNYGSWGGGAKSSMVTIAPESGASPTFSGGTYDTTVRNLTIQGITYTGMTRVNPPTGTLMNLVFDGDKWGNISCPISGSACADKEGRLAIIGGGSNALNSAGVQVKNSTFGPGGCSDGVELGGKGAEIGPNNEFMGIVQSGCDPIHTDSVQFYAGDYVNFHDNWIHGGDQGIMAPDGGTGESITNNAIIATNNYDIVAGNWDSSTIQHNYADADIYDGNPGNQPACGSHLSSNDVYRDNVGALDGCGTNITSDHNLSAASVTFAGGSGRCQWATASPTGTASDGTNIGMNCGTPPPNPECSDGINNDPTEDTLIDFPNDPGCSSATDNSELGNPVAAQCSDGVDNDSDGAIDFPADPGCASAADNDETNSPVDHTPVASFSGSPNPSAPSTAVTFDATGSACQDSPCSYVWVDDPPPAGGTTFPLSGSGAPAGQWTCSPTTSGCSTLTFTFMGTGTKYVTLTVTDADGDTDTVEHDQVVTSSPPPDTTPPDTTITSAPSNGTSTSASVSFTGTDNVGVASFECRIDGGSFAACTSPKSYTGLSVGSHTVDVRAKDAAGNVDASPASATWTISSPDTTPPDTSITTAPSNGTSTSASIPFTGTDNVAVDHFECKLDAGSYATCTSPKAYSGLSVGSHTFSVRAFDAAGNVDASPATATWTITASDSTPPDTTITVGPGATKTDQESTSLSFTGTDNVGVDHFDCKLDAESYATCTSPKAYSPLPLGSHTFSVRAVDAAGNVDPTPATRTWTVVAGAAPAAFVAEYEVSSWTTTGSGTKSVSVTYATGDTLVAYAGSEDSQYPVGFSLSQAGLTWTLRQSVTAASYSSAYVWTATAASAGSGTVSFTGNSAHEWGGDVLRYSSVSAVGASVVNHTASPTTPSLSITTTGSGSAIVWFSTDWNARDGASRTWKTTGIGTGQAETSYASHVLTTYTLYGGRWSGVSPGTYTVGLNGPASQKWGAIAIELKGVPSGGG